ncbi:MBL fold metallo-hydrolase [Alteromonas gilva]|uniref:MBL fold metallo-hydrolase n=1 Tax=Alteromonas gilva TaxID=2987522 RepID=A0ABT5L5L9_9ALTE|nr:MBL fold metallo-hydrolase [Alteromonas gilva]MDC8832336.1 MBL fold metallo-hydrolase [Alteromonas gilva]
MITPSSHPIPAPGELCEVASGIYWLRMPLPFALDHINLYVLEDEKGLYLLDTGVQSSRSKAVWLHCLAALHKPVVGVIVTHMHPDHCGLAGWLCTEFKVPLWMSALEYYAANTTFAPNPDADTSVEMDYFIQAGLTPEHAQQYVSDRSEYTQAVAPLPLAYHRLIQDDTLSIGGRDWQVLTFGGHSPEHVCLYCAADQLLIGGDQVLPYISPNIGVYSREPDANPLVDYFASLDTLAKLPDETLVLPSHNVPYKGLGFRCQALHEHHNAMLNQLTEFCQAPRTLLQCMPELYARELSGQLLFFALAEGLAHLNYLYYNGSMARQKDADGCYRYHTIGQQDTPGGAE